MQEAAHGHNLPHLQVHGRGLHFQAHKTVQIPTSIQFAVENSSDDEIKALKQEIQILGLKIEEMESVALRLNHLEEIIESLCFVKEKHSSEVCDEETQENPEESRRIQKRL